MHWTQTLNSLLITLDVPQIAGQKVSVKVSQGEAEISQGTKLVLKRKLAGRIEEEETFWSYESPELEIGLKKKEMQWWDRVFEGDKPIDTSALEPETITDASQLDAETRRQISKMLQENKR